MSDTKKATPRGKCHNWPGATDADGYGRFQVDGQWMGAHRYTYCLKHGSIPDGLQLDHLCRNRRCVNPDHLEPVTMIENILRGESPPAQNARKTHCHAGHELPARVFGVKRDCPTCRKEIHKRYREAHKESIAQYQREYRERCK